MCQEKMASWFLVSALAQSLAIIAYSAGIVMDLKVDNGPPGLEGGFSVAEGLPIVVLVKLLDVSGVGSFGEETLLIQQCQDTHGLKNKEGLDIRICIVLLLGWNT
jgi:hypothetical protein